MAAKKQGHPTNSFAQLVSDAQIKALQPFVKEMVAQAVAQAAQSLYMTMMQERAALLTRQLAFERLMTQNTTWFNENVLAMAVADVEDDSAGLVKADTVQENDKVRLELSVQNRETSEWTAPSKLAIHEVSKVSAQTQTVQTHVELEKGLIDMNLDETKEFTIPEQQGPDTTVRVTVKRVSRKKE